MDSFLWFLLALLCLFMFGLHVWGISAMAGIAKAKGHDDVVALVWWLSLFTGVFGYLLVIALPDNRLLPRSGTPLPPL